MQIFIQMMQEMIDPTDKNSFFKNSAGKGADLPL